MPGVQSASFGLAIAFVAPGVVALWGISLYVATVREWFGAAANSEATGAGFLFVLVASLAVGLFVSGVRQEVLDGIVFGRFMHLHRPETDESKLTNPDVLGALQFASENLYRYYQFYSNMALAVVVTYAAWLGHRWYWSRWRAGGLILLIAGVFALIRSATYSRKRYFHALEDIIGQEEGASS
jgi:hypothetical protein